MSQLRTLVSAYASVAGFELVRRFPGVYLLINGKFAWANVVYIGSSIRDIELRVRSHLENGREFDKVAVILPENTAATFIRNIEGLVGDEFYA